MLPILSFYGLLFLFLLFEEFQAKDLYTFPDGNVKISYSNRDLLITWQHPRSSITECRVQLLCAQTMANETQSVNSREGQVIMHNTDPDPVCTVAVLATPDTTLLNVESSFFAIEDDASSTPEPTIDQGLPSSTLSESHSSTSDSPSDSPPNTVPSNSITSDTMRGTPNLTLISSAYLDSASLTTYSHPSPSNILLPPNPFSSVPTPSQLAVHQPSNPRDAIIGGAIGGFLALCVLVALVLLYLRRRRRRLNQFCRLSEKQKWTDQVQHVMGEAEKQTGQAHSESRFDERQIHIPEPRRSEAISAGGYETSDETDDDSGEKRATASQKGKGRAIEDPYDSARSSLYGNESDIDSRSDDERHYLGDNSDLRHRLKADSLYLALGTGPGIAI